MDNPLSPIESEAEGTSRPHALRTVHPHTPPTSRTPRPWRTPDAHHLFAPQLNSDKWSRGGAAETSSREYDVREEWYDVGRRAVVCLHRQSESIHHAVWGAVPDIRISVLPKFTFENRLPIPIDFRLFGRGAVAAVAPAAASEAEAASELAPARQGADAADGGAGVGGSGAGVGVGTGGGAVPPFGWEPAGDEEQEDMLGGLSRKLGHDMAAVVGGATAAVMGDATADVAAALEGGGTFVPGGPCKAGGLKVGEHSELMREFVHDTELWLQLRYLEPSGGWRPASDTDPSPVEIEVPAAAPLVAMMSGEGEPSPGGGHVVAAEDGDGEWCRPEPLLIAEFEDTQQAAIENMEDPSLKRGLKARRDYLKFDLNPEMQVWVLLTGGGSGRPCRIVAYTDVCILNQTTLLLDFYLNKPSRPILPERPVAAESGTVGGGSGGGSGGGNVEDAMPNGVAKAPLSLLCSRPEPSGGMPELKLRVRGVSRAMSHNQRFEGEDGREYRDFSLCEPHERMLLGSFNGTFSTPFSTANATYHGETWLAEKQGVLGVQSQVQAQELVPRTAVLAIKPRFLLINKLDEAVQFYGAQMVQPTRVAGRPRAVSDVTRPMVSGEAGVVTVGGVGGGVIVSGGGGGAGTAHDREVEEREQADLHLEELPAALHDPMQLPAVPPGVVTPMYAFEPVSESKERLWLYLRLATPAGQWSPAISLNDEEKSYFFTEERGGTSHAQIMRVDIHEEGPTVFVTLESASDAPPCCVHNEASLPVFYQVHLSGASDAAGEEWQTLPIGVPPAHHNPAHGGSHHNRASSGSPSKWVCTPLAPTHAHAHVTRKASPSHRVRHITTAKHRTKDDHF